MRALVEEHDLGAVDGIHLDLPEVQQPLDVGDAHAVVVRGPSDLQNKRETIISRLQARQSKSERLRPYKEGTQNYWGPEHALRSKGEKERRLTAG